MGSKWRQFWGSEAIRMGYGGVKQVMKASRECRFTITCRIPIGITASDRTPHIYVILLGPLSSLLCVSAKCAEGKFHATQVIFDMIGQKETRIKTMSPIETEQLLLRPFRDEDVAPLYRIQSDPIAMRYTICSSSQEETEKRLRAYADSEKELGFASWTILQRSDERIIGWGGLNVDPYDPGWGVEVAYFFDPAYWGKGYASELVKISLQQGFNQHGLKEIHAFAHPENGASIRVLEKNGFVFLRFEPTLQRNHYLITKTLTTDIPCTVDMLSS
jgi:ribosomal-protein-alanine N-acetyltransferase